MGSIGSKMKDEVAKGIAYTYHAAHMNYGRFARHKARAAPVMAVSNAVAEPEQKEDFTVRNNLQQRPSRSLDPEYTRDAVQTICTANTSPDKMIEEHKVMVFHDSTQQGYDLLAFLKQGGVDFGSFDMGTVADKTLLELFQR